MSRIRTIKPEFWKHERLSELPEPTHMLAAALLNYSDDEGYFNANPKLVQAECSPLREPSVSIPDSLARLAEEGYLRLGTGSDGKRYGHVVHFSDHQKISHPTESKIKKIETTWDDAVSPPVILPEASSLKGTGKGREQGNARADENRKVQTAFIAFSAAYPKRKGNDPTEPARDKFERAVRDGADPEAIVAGALAYAAEQSKLGNVGTQFVKQRKAWLNDETWRDYQGAPANPNLPPPEPQEWVRVDDPRWPEVSARWRSARGKPPLALPGSHGNTGQGWHFPVTMLQATQ